jgi:hypothetical protein
MSTEALKFSTAILNSEIKLKPTAVLVFRDLAWRHDMTKVKPVSIQTIAGSLGKNDRNTNRAIRQLLAAGVIKTQPDRKPREAQLYLFPDGFDEPGSGAEYAAGLAIQRRRTAKSVAKSPHLMRPNGKAKPRGNISPGDAVEATYYFDGNEPLTSSDFSDDDLAQFDGHNDEGWRDKMNGGGA